MYLLDNNTCVYAIRQSPEVVTAFELEIGALRAQSRGYSEAVRRFLGEFPVLPPDDSAREAYGRLRTSLERQGERIGAHDMLIAAHAIALGAILVTNNEKEFRRVKGLGIENWVA